MLTIAIPTYNRAQCLLELLHAIKGQLNDLNASDVRVLISDNCSTDETEQVIRDEMSHWNRHALTYFKNYENVGFSRNVDLAVRRSQNGFVLLMGDDDGLEEGALRHILELTGQHPSCDVFLFGSNTYDWNMTQLLAHAARDGVKYYPDGADYVRAVGCFPPALVSGYVVKRESWLAVSPEEYAYSISIHMLVVTAMLLSHRSVVSSGRAVIRYRSGAASETWSKDPLYPFRFHLETLLACKNWLRHYDARLIKLLRRTPLRMIVYYLIRQRVVEHPFHVNPTFQGKRENSSCAGVFSLFGQLAFRFSTTS